MAEPTNTPVPASTPRSASPVHPGGPNTPIVPIMMTSALPPTTSSPASHSRQPSYHHRPRVLHIGDPVRYNPATYIALCGQCEVIRPSAPERERAEFIRALRERRWGDFHAVLRPFWGSGGEMGNWDEELISLLPPSVRVFASAGAGFDWADTKLLGERGIYYSNSNLIPPPPPAPKLTVPSTPGIIYCNSGLACAEAVADFAVAMIISTFRHLPWCIGAASSGDPAAFATCHRDATARSHNLRGHVLGIVGLGNVGQQIAARCRHGFGMEIHYYDVAAVSPDVEPALGAVITRHPSLESLIRASDCVVLCAPAARGGTSAPPLIGTEQLSWFRDGGRLVNVARGSLVDDEAVTDALEAGKLLSAALDVHPNEPQVSARLRALAVAGRVMLSCHNAGGTVETHRGFEELSMRNVMAVLSGGNPITPVNLEFLR